jgi:hypothetical protein
MTKSLFLCLREMGFENLRIIPSLRARRIGKLKSVGIIRKEGKHVKGNPPPSLRGQRLSGAMRAGHRRLAELFFRTE